MVLVLAVHFNFLNFKSPHKLKKSLLIYEIKNIVMLKKIALYHLFFIFCQRQIIRCFRLLDVGWRQIVRRRVTSDHGHLVKYPKGKPLGEPASVWNGSSCPSSELTLFTESLNLLAIMELYLSQLKILWKWYKDKGFNKWSTFKVLPFKVIRRLKTSRSDQPLYMIEGG